MDNKRVSITGLAMEVIGKLGENFLDTICKNFEDSKNDINIKRKIQTNLMFHFMDNDWYFKEVEYNGDNKAIVNIYHEPHELIRLDGRIWVSLENGILEIYNYKLENVVRKRKAKK